MQNIDPKILQRYIYETNRFEETEKMNDVIKKCAALCLAAVLALPLLVTASAANGFSWYCIREKDNRRPRCPSEFAWIKEESAVWIDETACDESAEGTIYLTFDVGYENGNVAKILDVLKEKNIPAAFFVLLNVVEKCPELIMRMESEGHTVCNHSARHKDITKLDKASLREELERLEGAYKALTGHEMKKIFRAPEGRFDAKSISALSEMGYSAVFWSFAYADWDNAKQPSADKAKKTILGNIHNGAVLLLHPTSATNAAIMADVIDEIEKMGYRFGTVEELLENCARARGAVGDGAAYDRGA